MYCKIVANLGDSNNSENFLSIDFGRKSYLPGIVVKHKQAQFFNFHRFDIGRLYAHDGEFSVSLLGLDAKGELIAEQQFVISEPLSHVELGDKFNSISELLINAVYVDDIDNRVACLAITLISASVTVIAKRCDKIALMG
ncbi:hypothetical protein [Psychromonas hadalis]|uniref:hypothetical protein n=1 Tax=Psychromonas hadalis TaxID=211669 RepID=UPI0003B58FD1|nr:hypothetical protein [Psychromonas hadalis]